MTRPSLAFGDREYTRAELDALASGMATTLEHRGVRAGERVALMSSNRPEFVVAMRAIWALGAAVVLVSTVVEAGRGGARAGADHAVTRRRRQRACWPI